MSTVSAAVLDPLLAADPAGPRITYYDDATGERIELSTVTMANWAAKTANLLRDEMGAGPGTRVAVLLPAHWQTAAVLFGIWWIGSEVLLGGGSDNSADLALCTRERLDEADEAVAGDGQRPDRLAHGVAADAKRVGELVAERAKAKGVGAVVFDRAGNKYHGRVAAVADGAREGGLAL